MSASTGDKITDVRNAARPNSARVSSGRSSGGTTLACDSLSGWPTASKVHFVTYQIDSNSNPVAGTQLDCYGIVSGNSISSFTVIDGTDNGNSVNDVVEMLPTAAWAQDLADALTSQHSRTGAHVGVNNTGGMTTDTLTASSTITVTGGATLNGGTTLPAGDIGTADLASNAVTTAKITAANVTAAKLIYGTIRNRQGVAGDTDWAAAGTTSVDVSATDVFVQVGSISVTADPTTVTFPTAYTKIPIVISCVSSANSFNCYVVQTSISITAVGFRTLDDGGVVRTSERVFWIAIGK